jgi:DNA-binding FadR family transcriptional regulator
MITSGELRAGARLPVEKELAASLAVSRGLSAHGELDHEAILESDLVFHRVIAKASEHQAILAALRVGSADGARIRMANHLLGVQDFLEAQSPAESADGSSSADSSAAIPAQ